VLVKLLVALALAYAIVCALAFLAQRRLQYFPDPRPPALPPKLAAAGVREVQLSTDDGLELAAWHWPAREGCALPTDLTVIVFHGNAGNRGGRAGWLTALNSTGMGVLAPDYRGYGGNPGSPSEPGLYRDGEAAVRWAREHLGGRLVFLGESLGGGVAVEMAARHRPAALILESATSSCTDVARHAYPWLPAGLLLRDRFDAERRIPEVTCPLLALHGEEDRVIPLELGQRLYQAARCPKTWWPIQRAGHDGLIEAAGPEYLRRLTAFLADLAPVAQPPDTTR
jgi:fermentation-respiration switch protein FrsA (DUF1100 family)